MTFLHPKFKLVFSFGLFFFTSLFFSLWSYILVDGNLVFSTNPVYWRFQQWLWQNFLPNKNFLTLSYFFLVFLLFLAYFLVVFALKRLKPKQLKKLSLKKLIFVYLVLSLPFILAYNALSYDVFNYIFNAKMVLVYHANPHVQVALDFASDPWTRFMHNTHTPAPYGYAWTGFSLLPYIFGLGKFSLTWLGFKFFAFLSLLSLFFVLRKTAALLGLKVKLWHWAVLFLNPLVLIEILANAHNDIWMMSAFLLSFNLLVLVLKRKKLKFFRFRLGKWLLLTLSLFFFFLAGWVKFASFVTLPWYGLLVLFALIDLDRPKSLFASFFYPLVKSKLKTLLDFSPLVFTSLFFLLLFSSRSRQFLPWYLSWSLVFLPLLLSRAKRISVGVVKVGKETLAEKLPRWSFNLILWLVAFSISSLYRYLPWLYYLDYTPEIIKAQKLVTWVGGVAMFGVFYLLRKKIIFRLIVD